VVHLRIAHETTVFEIVLTWSGGKLYLLTRRAFFLSVAQWSIK